MRRKVGEVKEGGDSSEVRVSQRPGKQKWVLCMPVIRSGSPER